MVVVKKRQAASFGLNDGPLVVNTTPHIGDAQSCLLRDVYKLDLRGRDSRQRLLRVLDLSTAKVESPKSPSTYRQIQKEMSRENVGGEDS
ncbi:hypothetical protein [Tunturiibacter gelidiferens]|uniref:hypothetical protein n=1 Tax=Tunturiibacter gelidiferens TaxID=3069689 RepID=UPI003D9AE0A6